MHDPVGRSLHDSVGLVFMGGVNSFIRSVASLFAGLWAVVRISLLKVRWTERPTLVRTSGRSFCFVLHLHEEMLPMMIQWHSQRGPLCIHGDMSHQSLPFNGLDFMLFLRFHLCLLCATNWCPPDHTKKITDDCTAKSRYSCITFPNGDVYMQAHLITSQVERVTCHYWNVCKSYARVASKRNACVTWFLNDNNNV